MSVRPPHVCIVSCAHPIDDVRVMHKECAELRAAGFRVSWVGPDRGRRENTYGVEFHLYPPARSRAGRFLHHRHAMRLGRTVGDVDVFFAVEPDSAVAAIALAKACQARAVFDVHEAYDEYQLAHWVPKTALPLAGAVVRRAIRAIAARCDLVIGVNEPVLAPYANSTKSMIVRNCAPRWFADPAASEVFAASRRNVTIMHGKSTLHRGTDIIVEAVGFARGRAPRLMLLLFDFFSQNPDKLDHAEFQSLVERAGATGLIDLRPMIPMEDMPAVLRECDIGIIAYARMWGRASLPNKLFEFMACGLPVIAPVYAPEIRAIVEAERCGLLVDTEDPRAISQALIYLCEHPAEARRMGERGRSAFLARHNWSAEFSPAIERFRAWAAESQQVSRIPS